MHSRRADRFRTRGSAPRRAAVLLVAAAAVLTACGSDAGSGSAESTPDPKALVGKTYLSDAATSRDVPGGGPFVLAFPAPGRLSANAGCNGHGGTATFDGDRFTAGSLMGTMMACPPPKDGADRWVTDLLAEPLTWSLRGRTLTLSRDDRTIVLNERVDRSVAGTTWRVTALERNNGVESSVALERAKPTLMIGADSTVRGWSGCNDMRGEATVTADENQRIIHFGPIGTTRRACPDDGAADVERAVLAALSGDVTATVDGDELRLRNVKDPSIGLRLTVGAPGGRK